MAFSIQTIRTLDKRFVRAGVWRAGGQAPRAICVLLQGLTEFLEKHQEVAGELAGRGFTVVSLDWRSQGASERGAHDTRKGHVPDFEDYVVDLTSVLSQVVQPLLAESPGLPIFALGHSMGGHILLRYLHENARRFAFAVLSAPMIDIHLGRFTPWQASLASTFFNLTKPSTRFVFGCETRDPLAVPFSENQLTSDEQRYARNVGYLKAHPFLRIFGPTFGWLHAALKSIRLMRQPDFASSIVTPLLIFGAGSDEIVITQAIRDFAKHAPNARYVEIPGSKHEILMEKDAIREIFWKTFDGFVEEQLAKPGNAGR